MLAAIQMYCVKSSVPLYRRLTASCRMTVACMAKISPVIVESTKDVREMILDQFDVFIFDMDGVLWRTEEAIEGARRALDFLKAEGKKLFFATNNSMHQSLEYAEKMKRLGLGDQEVSAIFNSANAVALYLESINFKGKIYMMGTEALKAELEALENVELLDGFNHRHKFALPKDAAVEEVDLSVDAVVMGFDPYFNYYKSCYATTILNHNPKALFIATNHDPKYPTARWTLPGTGSFISTVETATGRQAAIAGKPSAVILNQIRKRCPNVPKHRIVMVGDNLKTDIDFGRRNGIATILVETGVHTREDFKNAQEAVAIPDLVIRSIADLAIPN